MARGFSKGFYNPRHPEKYKGDLNKIIYRSSWELDFCKFLDNNPNILEWVSEPFGIPYFNEIDKKYHKYYPDFLISYKNKEGKLIKELIEIKPSTQVQEPTTVGKKSKQQLYERLTYIKNICKWKAAQEFCNNSGITFRILTESKLFN